MDREEIRKILDDADVLIEDPRFSSRVFRALCTRKKKEYENTGDNLKIVATDDHCELSRSLDKSELQESCSVRNVLKSRRLAKILIDDNGTLNVDIIPAAISLLTEHQYSLGPNRQYDAKRNEHQIKVLEQLIENKQLLRQLKSIEKPQMHRHAEDIIREALNLPHHEVVTDAHARRATLSAWLTYLRQNVGSCFATAPAIIVHNEQPAVFLKDIQELLSTGRLKRTFGGIEYAVPLSYTWGAGDLRRVFAFQKGGSNEDHRLWKSPGLIRAFEAAGIINPDLSRLEKEKTIKSLILDQINEWPATAQWFYTNIETLIRKILLKYASLTEEDIKDYELRPKGMILGGIFMNAPKASGGKGEKCAEFLQKFEETKDSFKVLADNALLKSWEFSIASFAETKSEFTKWNLYASLGLRPDDKGGIGPCLYEILKRKLDECNRKVQDLQYDYEQAYSQLMYVQSRMRHISSEKEAQWLRADYQAKSSEFQTLEEMRDSYHDKARRYANLYDGLIDIYFHLFPNYFQEVYDADILEVASGPFDDSPAGFRLLYKHGRTNTSQWTLIRNHSEFIDALVGFFNSSERELLNTPELKGAEDDLSEIVTSIVNHIRSKEFIESAFHRMAAAHNTPAIKNPLENLDKIEKKPWVYTSGGAINTLISCYFKLDSKPTEVSRWVENPVELLIFLIDSIKEIPEKTLDTFLENPDKSLLIHSPTHAFLLKPGYPKLKEAWQSKTYTYIWIRDEVVKPMLDFSDKLYIDDIRMRFTIDKLLLKVPVNYRPYFKDSFYNLGGGMRVSDFRRHILDTIDLSKGLQYAGRGVLSSDDLDSELYSLFPLFPSYKLKERVETIVSQLPGLEKKQCKALLKLLDEISGKIGTEQTISATGLQEITKTLIALTLDATTTSLDYPLMISQIAQKEGFAMPTPFIFADTNWVKDHFGFLVNPGNNQFELWRIDYTGSRGAAMSDWSQWLDGSQQKPDWGVYNKPYEYTQLSKNGYS